MTLTLINSVVMAYVMRVAPANSLFAATTSPSFRSSFAFARDSSRRLYIDIYIKAKTSDKYCYINVDHHVCAVAFKQS